ncbi:kinase-like protein [Annulohypoxylon moriforme]|nr:kinase-like protein [Annulohypoxylon moriforme]
MEGLSNLNDVEGESTSQGDEHFEETQLDPKKSEYATKIEDILVKLGIENEKVQRQLQNGISDFWIPMPKDAFPGELDLSHYELFNKAQSELLKNEFTIPSDKNNWPQEHLNLHQSAINKNTHWPVTLTQAVTPEQANNNEHPSLPSSVLVVKYGSENYLLRQIRRTTDGIYKDKLSQMHRISEELGALRKLRPAPRTLHFIKLAASYTDIGFIGMLLSPVPDCNLADFLDSFKTYSSLRMYNESLDLLERFFGCLSTAMAYLHFTEKVRHGNINPENIFIKGKDVLITGFEFSINWIQTDRRTTRQKGFTSGNYCAPEVDQNEETDSKSDIWSLGCVFLEMITVLRGAKRSRVKATLKKHGSSKFYESPKGIEALITELEGNTSQDWKKLVGCIQEMLQHDKTKRPAAMDLRRSILDTEYCADCCKIDLFENETSGLLIEHSQ